MRKASFLGLCCAFAMAAALTGCCGNKSGCCGTCGGACKDKAAVKMDADAAPAASKCCGGSECGGSCKSGSKCSDKKAGCGSKSCADKKACGAAM